VLTVTANVASNEQVSSGTGFQWRQSDVVSQSLAIEI
jgi:hypothetical protein